MTCRNCGAEIIWAKTETGASLPVDAQAVPDGNLHLRHFNMDDPPLAVTLTPEQIEGLKLEHARRVKHGWEKEPFGLHVSHATRCAFWDERAKP